MNDWLLLILLFLTGALLAVIYLGGLWLTVQRLQHCRYPALCLMTSMLVRMLLLLTAFYFILGDGHWPLRVGKDVEAFQQQREERFAGKVGEHNDAPVFGHVHGTQHGFRVQVGSHLTGKGDGGEAHGPITVF